MRVAILGRTRMLFDTIKNVIDKGHEIVVIGTCKAAPEYDITETDFEMEANRLGVPFFCNSKINSEEVLDILKSAHADVAISVNWLTLIKEEVIGCFKYGILNAHCGDLPRYRGNACPNWAIINGEKSIGVAVHFMNPGELDSGDIVVKRYFPLLKTTTISEVYDYIRIEIPQMFSEAIEIIESDPSKITPQSKKKDDIYRCYPRIESDSFIDWNLDVDSIDRIIRASCRPFKGAYTYYGNRKIYILKASQTEFETPCSVCPGQVVSIDRCEHTVGVACKDGIIILESIESESGESVKPDEVLSSMRIRLGYCISDEIYEIRKEIDKIKQRIGIKENENR